MRRVRRVRRVRLPLPLPLRVPLLLLTAPSPGTLGGRGAGCATVAPRPRRLLSSGSPRWRRLRGVGPMLNRPRFRPHFHVEVVPGEGVFLLSDSRQTLLRGRLFELVTPWLDGRTADDVCHQLRGTAAPAAVYYSLLQLERKEYLCEADAGLPAGQAALWSSQQVAPAAATRRLAERAVVVQAFGIEAGP